MQKKRQLTPKMTENIFRMERVEREWQELTQSQWYINNVSRVVLNIVEYTFSVFNVIENLKEAIMPFLSLNSTVDDMRLFIKASVTVYALESEKIDDKTEERAIKLIKDTNFINSTLERYENIQKDFVSEMKGLGEDIFGLL